MTELLSMRDIADLARVQRPVVTVWRGRARHSGRPFPNPQEHRQGQALFARDEVVGWLEATRRGNNPEVRLDAPTFGSAPLPAQSQLQAVSALLTLRRLLGVPLTTLGSTADDILDVADSEDPDDLYLYRELAEALDLPALCIRAEALAEAAWDAAEAHRLLVAHHRRDPSGPSFGADLSALGSQLITGLIGPLVRDLDASVMDASGCLLDVFADLARTLDVPALIMEGDSPAHRMARRQLLLAGVPHTVVPREDGDWSVPGPVVHLLVLPAATDAAAVAIDQLSLLDEVALQLDDRQVVLCLAPAATLVDPLSGETVSRRDQLLRDGYVRAIVRLPGGLRTARAREQSALWLLAAADRTPAQHRRTLVADLSGASLAATDGLADDLLAAWQGREGARRRAWAHLHSVPTGDLISSGASLTPPRPARRTVPLRTGTNRAVQLRTSDTAGRLAGYGLDPIDEPVDVVTVGQALDRRWLRVLPGHRLDPAALRAGTVPVIGSDDLAPGGLQRRRPAVDRLSLLAQPSVQLTEPGDVVFTVRPAPRACLDVDGGALVLFPARVLRIAAGAPLVARAVVARIGSATGTAWRTWTLASVPEPERSHLSAVLDELAAQRETLLDELRALHALTHDLTEAVESRQLSITKENHGPTPL